MPRSQAPLPGAPVILNRASVQAQSLLLWYPTLNAGGPALHEATGRFKPALAATTAPTRYTDGTLRRAFSYDGVAQWIDTGVSLPAPYYSPMTLMAWVRRTASAGADFVKCILAQDSDTLGRTFAFGIQGTGITPGVADALDAEVNGTNYINDTVAAPLNTWFHAAWTYNGTTHRLYKNGVEVANGPIVVPGNSTTTLSIGRRNYAGFEGYWPGQIADVRFYGAALSAAVVAHCAAAATRWDLYALQRRRPWVAPGLAPPPPTGSRWRYVRRARWA